ncbi:acetylornithine deacetylase [Idiomarina sp. MD25a]|uniref:acetylornithine deacetylase n=1 Tax=Idiomarina sp. MD25a TaxID=1889913 RepID=UPI0008F92172|nr:acetylornithine deacetylase [Idiomarina sp. MD25a]OIM97921.1 acetylornithine deacetylase [Idiomarina sp. MD25a]
MSIPSFFNMYQALIARPSISSLDPSWDHSNKAVIELLADWLEQLAFDVEIQPLNNKPNKFNLLATRGVGSGGLLLSGHTDTVPYDQQRWNFDPFKLTEKDNRWYGLGAIDMKGFFAFIIEALRDLPANQQTKPIQILATADEETTMDGARQLNRFNQLKPDYCIIGEPTEMRPIRAHKGHLTESIRVTGRSGHSSNPALGINAIEIMHQVISKLLEFRNGISHKYSNKLFEIPYPTLNLGAIHGGDNANRICGCCELHIDIRPLPGMSLTDLYSELNTALNQLMLSSAGTIELTSMHPPIPGFEQAENSKFVQLTEQISGVQAESVNYCTEAPFIQQLGCDTLVLGPGSIKQAHQPDEFLDLSTVNHSQQAINNLIRRLCF